MGDLLLIGGLNGARSRRRFVVLGMFTTIQLAFLGQGELFSSFHPPLTRNHASSYKMRLGFFSRSKTHLSSFCRINVDGTSLDISYEEWRDYLLFHPSSDLADIISSWRHNTVSMNMNEQIFETRLT